MLIDNYYLSNANHDVQSLHDTGVNTLWSDYNQNLLYTYMLIFVILDK